MPVCRIYLFTYKRNHLLPRAVTSLLNQTLTDWVCELHNDDPADGFPAQYISSLKDDRFVFHGHAVNMGAIGSFNLAFSGCKEPYASILEDDNWWEPAFLSTMIALLDKQPGINVAWSNMRLWQEKTGNRWENLNRTIWPAGDQTSLFSWPSARQSIAALHSNSGLLYRTGGAAAYIVPENVLLNAVELVRERSFEHPLCLCHQPLANFAVTLETNRTDDPYTWIATQVMLLASFIDTADDRAGAFRESLRFWRQQTPSPVANFFLANKLLIRDKKLNRLFTLSDWFMTGKWLLRNGHRLAYIKKYLRSQSDTYDFLLQKTRMRYRESKQKKSH
ncbi:glycosyltransferase family 2 protein [Mucilaginibacter sp. AW1-7]|uniref:glycosyltransferase family 2 protein n=1 Tax=Mucilaginibacter sp. AW1-7 TaxID=3349874 RepID=UPI003F73C4FD